MQGEGALLNVLTVPPGAGINDPRVVIDGVRGAIFVYGPGGALIGSWAGQAGTDPYGNAYPQGFNGALGVIAGTDFLVYNGTPALGTLIGSWSGTGGTDIYGNVYPQGFMVQDTSGTAQGIFTVQDANGNTVLSIDNAGNLSGNVGSFNDLNIAGQNLFTDIINPIPEGIINRGWAPAATASLPWPPTALGTTETALLELDTTIPAGRRYRFVVMPADILPTTAPAGNTQYVQRIRYTTDGSTPTTSSQEVTGHSPIIIQMVPAALNNTTPMMEWLPGAPLSDTLYRMLVSANIQSGAYKFQTLLECRWEDLGPDGPNLATNSGVVLGSGGSGGGGGTQTYTKTYVAVEFASYYGDTATYGSGAYGRRSYNASSGYQGCASGYVNLSGDQYCFARFNYGQIATDLGAGTINWTKLRLTNQHFWYNGGGNAIVGWSSYTGSWGDPFVPGSGTHFNQEHYHMNEGQTLDRTMGSWLKSAITTGFTTITLGTSASYTNRTDLNNYGYWAMAGNVNTAPRLTINYTK